MFWKSGKNKIEPTEVSEDEIQDEIRKRILKESQKRDGKEHAEDMTQATLDALEDVVTLSREEMEAIAEAVRNEYKKETVPEKETGGSHRLIMWTSLSLIVVTFLWARRGSSWLFFCGLILLFILLNGIRSKKKKDD